MTELQMGLIGLGAAAVVGVFGYNKWQEMRQRKLAEAVLKPQHEDVLLARVKTGEPVAVAPESPRQEPELRVEESEPSLERVEPVLVDPTPTEVEDAMAMAPTPEPEPAIPAPAIAAEPVAPLPVVGGVAEAAPEIDAGPVPAELLDPRLEFVVAMELVEPVSSLQILHSQRSALHRLNKPVHWIGFNEKTREWQRLAQDGEVDVRRLRVGLQLVNRLGPVSEGDLAIFTNAMQALADELMAVADMPPSRVLDQAAEIDRFCAAVDLEIGLNLVSRGSAFPGTKIRALAEAAGMMLGADGLFTRYDDAGRAQFSLQNFESTPFSVEALRSLTTHGLTFLLDVPRVDHGERVFMQMTEVAKRFADTLQGALVDDNRQPLSDAQLDHIRREFIGKPQATMAGFGLAAGSPQALRLFS
ncbi:cell division protein ZipA C-terminal FtsZ-binding domain-containing protein [Dechloromonas agitata]|uniref:cell division protein ZipA C-terminal FtsZ-binding domain-containing protein n=1 Tax=Dechloromonas agitata TaxID=73030 RepID=UPI0004815736|nr:cell division protein ZipA C-terminal FtsZ-binding domain-containing protein [Dechloromonas agitata]MDE1544140.1 cell division protein ZipA C-terminal FtsZ-binding domain-containing protein [Dechloromonas agitata]